MRAAIWAVFVVTLASCASTPDEPEDHERPPGGPSRASAEEMYVYIETVQPEAVSHVRFKLPLRWKYLNDYFVIMETRDGPHLVEMESECRDLRPDFYNIDMVDVRAVRGVIRVHDTIRRCRIKTFYKLPEVDAVETPDDDAPD